MVFDCLGLNCIGKENKKKNVVYEQTTFNVCLFALNVCSLATHIRSLPVSRWHCLFGRVQNATEPRLLLLIV